MDWKKVTEFLCYDHQMQSSLKKNSRHGVRVGRETVELDKETDKT